MAEKRMFTKKITDSDAFIEMSSAAQALYFHLNQSADDDGFNNQIQMAMFRSHASIDDLRVLMMKNFIIRFESGVIVIKHWRMHNTLRKDRYNPTNFQDELSMLNIKENGAYSLTYNDGCQVVAEVVPQISIDKVSIDKVSKEENREVHNGDKSPRTPIKEPKHKYGEYKNVLLTDTELTKLNEEYGTIETVDAIQYLDEYIEIKETKYKRHYLVLKKWVYDAVKQKKNKKNQSTNGHKQSVQELASTLEDWQNG